MLGTGFNMFGKDKNTMLFTHLIVKVRKFESQSPYFYLETTIADEKKATEVTEKLNEIATLQKEKGWQEQFYNVALTL